MKQIGVEIINGLIEGIKQKVRDALAVMGDLAKALPDWAKKLLGIHSPSVVFREIGENVGAGLAQGIDASLPKVSDAADRLVEVVSVDPSGQPRYALTGKFKSAADSAQQGTGLLGGVREYVAGVASAADQAKNLMVHSFQGMEDALTKFIRTGKWDFRSLIDTMEQELARLASSQLLKSIGGWLGGSSGSSDGFFASLLNMIFSANGNVFAQGKLVPFASGGAFTNSVVNGATAFPLGMMGEAGPEAIVPLSRMSNGQLGVMSGGGAGVNVQVNVIESPGSGGQQRSRQEGNTRVIDVMVEQIKGAIASDISRGSGPIPAALGSTYGLSRAPGAY
jgi:hypothetical protein